MFTDRVEEQKVLRDVLAPVCTSKLGEHFLLTQFYGVGGMGKSTLCRKVCKTAAADDGFKNVRVVTVSFDDSRWKQGLPFTEVCAELCRWLAKEKLIPKLSTALLLLHYQQTGRNDGMVANLEDGLSMVFAVLEKGAGLTGIPGLDVLVKGAQWLRGHAQQEALRKRLKDLDLWPEDQFGKFNILDLQRKLSRALYHDVTDWLKENPSLHLRLLLDGFECLQSSESAEDSQQRLQQFIGYFANKGEGDPCDRFRVAIFGRNQLRWDEIYTDESWTKYWNLHLLGGLAEKDALEFLKKFQDWLTSNGQTALANALKKYESRILDAADAADDETTSEGRAIYPYYLDLAVEFVERARRNGEEPDLGRCPAELQDRFLHGLKSDELRALMVLALSERFDEGLFDWLAKERLINYAQQSFRSQLRSGHSYLEEVNGDPDDWHFVKLMEEALHARWQSTLDLKREGSQMVKRVLEYYGAPLLAKPERDWGQDEAQRWSRGMEIIVTQGPELGLLAPEAWKPLLEAKPWSIDHFRCLEQRLDFARRISENGDIFRPEHPDTLSSLNNLAGLLHKKGDYAAAESLHCRALEARERILGPEHPDTLASLNNLAVLLSDKGDDAAAEPLYRRALEAQERIFGPYHLHTLRSLKNLALLLKYKGDAAAAEPLYRRALEARERILGPEHPKTLSVLNNLAPLLNATGRLAEAVVLLREHAAKSEACLAYVRYNLACYECLSGNLAEAKRLIAAEITAKPKRKDRALADADLTAIHDFIASL